MSVDSQYGSLGHVNRRPIRRRSTLERIKAFYAFFEQNGPIYISDLKQIGFDNPSVEKMIKIIRLIQNKPPVIVEKAGKFTTIKLEGS